MKKLLQTCFTLGLLFFGNFLFGQNLDFTIKYNTYTSEYEVYARPDFTESTFFVAAGSQLSIAVPASVGDVPFVVTSVTGGPWSDNSRVFAPAADASQDFHGIASDGLALVNFASGVEELLFTFKLPLSGCVEGIRLFENTSDPQPADAGMFNTDFNNFFGDAFVLFSDYYQVNYNNNGTVCSDPMLVPIPLTVEMDSSGVVCMNVLDANQLDSFTVNTCGATNGTPNATINGSVVCVEYQPNNGYVGTDSVCVYVCDQTGNCDTTIVPITVVAPPLVTTVPEPPIVYPSPITVPQDSTIALCVPVLDPNAGNTFTPTLCGVPNGIATPSIDNGKLCLTYTPDAGFSGDTEICVVVCDQTGLCDTVTFPVTVYPLPLQADSNQAPIVTFPAVVTPEDTPISTCGTIADANTTDTYTAIICATPANVTATATIDNTNNQVCINVTPNLHFNGHDVVCLSVCDQNGKCDTIQVPVTVTPVNDKPIAVLDRDTTDEDILIVFDVQGNDIEIDNDPLTTTVIGNSTQGSTPTVVNDSISYLPPLNFYGIDTITYQVCDNGIPQLCDTAIAIIQVGPINDVPVAMGDTTDVNEDEYVIVMVQMDDEDVDMDDLTTSVIIDPVYGTYSIISMDSIQYKADTNYTGMDMLMYEICDNGLSPQLCDTATVYINIIPVNDKPIALNDSAIVTMNINNNIIPIQINDSDIEDSLLYTTPISSSRGATLSAVNDTLLRYDPPHNYSGYDTVMYQICDHDTPDLCDTATVIVFVKPDGDNDGIANVDDLDDDNDGIPDAIEGYGDADGDGIPNNFDLDSDNDGIQDILEAGGADVNGDGRIDIAGADFDAADADDDGLMDIIDSGSGVNDTLSNLTNGSIYTDFPTNAIDTDRDGLPDYLDVDADNDGLPDLIEAGGVDTDGDGRIDTPIDNDADGWTDIYDGDYDAILSNGTDNPQGVGAAMGPLMVTVGDANADGTPGTAGNGGFSGGDFDRDLVPDFRDLDSDNDGNPDLIEAGGTDIEGDGIVDDFVDADNDGYDDNYDTDDDGLFGREDPITEPLVTTDPDGTGTDEDGRPTDDDADGTAIKGITADIDSDGNPDYKDLDADNDGIPDLIEMGGTDVNGDGEIDNFVDVDDDGFDDRYDTNDNKTTGTNDGTGSALVSTDPEGSTDDGRPEDNDNDGTVYNGETADIDQDGLPDSEDLDADNDGIPDLMEMGGTDTDGNGIIDNFVDVDDDGFEDTYDAEDNTTSTANDGGEPLITTDPEGTTNDGRPEDDDADGTPYNGITADVDSDGFPDSEDLDADNDGLPDLIEMGGTDTDGNGIIDDFNDANNDGFDDTYTTTPLTTTDPEGSTDDGRPEDDDADGTAINGPTADVDMDGLLDSEDVDADNDGLPDLIEMGGTDTDGNGRIDDFVDTNNDGFDDTYEANPLTTTDPEGSTDDGRPEDDDADGTTINGITADIDSDGFPDSEDLDADQDGLPDLIEIGGTDTDGNGIIDDFNDTNNDGFDDTYTTDPLITTDPEGTTDDGRPEDDDSDNTPYNGETADVDMDGFPDSEDLDADNDGIPDLIEMNGLDVDENGIIDNFTDTNNDGFDDTYTTTPLITTDPEGSTNDGRPEDDDSDGTPYNAPEADVDNDGIPNSEDLDTDNDGISDVVENGHGDLDTDDDGTIDPDDTNYADTDMDGIPDPIDEAPNDYGDDVAPEVDTDQDNTPDYKDIDADGDGINDVDEIGLGDLDTDNDGIIDETDADQDGIADTPDSNDDDADDQDFGGLATPTTDDWLNRSIRLVRVDPIKEIVIIKNFSDIEVDISGYRLCSEFNYTTDLTSQTIIAGDFTLAADEEVTIKLDEISLTDAAADLALYIAGTTNFGDTVALQDFTQWGSGGHGRESLATDKGIWEPNTYVSPNELPYFYYTGTGIEDGALFWKGHLIATLTPEGEPKQICADTTWTLNHPITASDCGGNTSGTATGAGGTYTIDAITGCINYVAPLDAAVTSDTVCIVICDKTGLCDTSYAIFPIDTIDVAYPPNPLDPEEERTVCVDTSWVVKGPINVTDCNDANSGNATPNGGAYTVDANTGCVTYSAPANATTAFDTVCIIVCDDFGICDTSDIVFPLDTSDVEYPVTPVDILDSTIVCVDTSWATGPVATITDCDNANTGIATPNGGIYTVDPETGCVEYTAPAGPVITSQDTVCLIVCDVNGVCDTSIMVFPIDTIDVVYPITPVDPGETHEVCPDTAWVTDSPLVSSNCDGTSIGAATPNGGAYTIDAATGCVTYTYPTGTLTTLSDTVCIVTCDPNGICDTSIAVFPLDTIDIKFPPIAVDPTAMPTVCVDTGWVANGPLTASDCAGNTSGIAPSNGGTYTIDPATGCVTYTPPSTPLNTSHDTVCVVICDITNVCDTSIIVFPLDTIDQAMPIIPVVPGDTSMVCVDTSWITQMPIVATDCNGQPFGNAMGVMGEYSVDVTTGCITYVAPESMIDVAGDTICMILCDANGVCDTSEVVFLFDMDGDYVADVHDYDDDNDGIPDAIEGMIDTDGDGIYDLWDLDSDNDGIQDVIEAGGVDNNGDGRIDINGINWNAADADNDGLLDVIDSGQGENDTLSNLTNGTIYTNFPTTAIDTDGDGISDFRDIDSDNDGITDLIEAGGADENGDGRVDVFVDNDADGWSNYYDADNDVLLFNGVDNPQDLANETGPLMTTDPDTNADGTPGTNGNGGFNGGDFDGDATPDFRDLDSDNDGLPDLIEVGGTDENGDGQIDDFNDADQDGYDDNYDTDDDGIAGIEDPLTEPLITTDPDGSGADENGRPTDTDNNVVTYNGQTVDIDGDGNPDHLDLDADNDGIPDLIEAGGTDEDGDGQIDNFNDTDKDGFDDSYDPNNNSTSTPNDGTGEPLISTDPEGSTDDGRPEDDDNDGSPYNGETADVDSDGIPDSEDLDADNDGIPDLIEMGGTDTDGNGVIDDFNDPDGDGFDNTYDADNNATPTDNDGGTPLVTTDPEGTTDDGRPEDNDADGTAFNGPTADIDNDGIMDSEDVDADNDGITDLIEVGGTDTDGDGQIDDFSDADNDGFDDTYSPETSGLPLITTDPEGTTNDGRPEDDDNDGTAYNADAVDTDKDGVIDSEDLDSDNDGLPDLIETGGTDTDGDGQIDNPVDADKDGYDDRYDTNDNTIPGTNDGSGDPLVKTDGEGTTDDGRPEDVNNDGTVYDGETADVDSDGIPDMEDLDSDNDGLPDLIEMGGTDEDGNGIIDDFNDTDGDGFDDTYSPETNGTPLITTDPEGTTNDGRPEDTDNNGTPYNGETADVDFDGVPDSEDLDADNDGIPDLIEMGGTDEDGDGFIDDFNDADGNGFDDTYSPETSGNPLISTDPEGTTEDGRPEDDDNDNTAYNGDSADIDSDGVPDSEDVDADNDGIPDLIEVGGTDEDGDGRIDDFDDIDNDGFEDNYDPDNNTTIVDEDNTSNPLITTDSEGTTDDGRPEDDDNDGTAYNGETADVDSDGIPDNEDLDADNDGIPDLKEMGGVDEDRNGIVDDFTDENKDGFEDAIKSNPLITTDPEGTTDDGRPEDDDSDGSAYNGNQADEDSDGTPNSEDLDTDNDGIGDVVESGHEDLDTDNDGTIDADDDNFEDTDNDGIPNPIDENPSVFGDNNEPTRDTDRDEIPDYLDTDSDNDGISDIAEAGNEAQDQDNDGRIDDLEDSDNDGIADFFDDPNIDSFGGISPPIVDYWIDISIRLVRVDPIRGIIKIKNFSIVNKDISGYKLNTGTNLIAELSNQIVIDGALSLNPGEEVTLQIAENLLPDNAGDLALYLNGTTDYTDVSALLDYTQWHSGGNGVESVAVDKGIWTAGTFISPIEFPYYYYVGDGVQNGALYWKGHLIAPLTDSGNSNSICGDVSWTLNTPISAKDCQGSLTGIAMGAGGNYTIDANTGCIHYTAPDNPMVLRDTVCIIICDTSNRCDTSMAIFPIDTIDYAYPPNPIEPEEERTVCVDTSWILLSPINATNCNNTLSGTAIPNGGTYTINPVDGCVTYTAPAAGTVSIPFDTVCIVLCDDFGLCDTSEIVFPLDTTKYTVPDNPVEPGDSTRVCGDTTWITTGPITANDCAGALTGLAFPNAGTYTIHQATGCIDYVAPSGMVAGSPTFIPIQNGLLNPQNLQVDASPATTTHDTVCLVICDGNKVCDTTNVIFPLDTIAAPIEDTIPLIIGTTELCGDITWIVDGPIKANDCNGSLTGQAYPNNGQYTVDPTTGCVTYEMPANPATTTDTMCLVICDAAGVCDTQTLVFDLAEFDLALMVDLGEGQNWEVNSKDTIRFSIQVYNQGEAPAYDIEISDYIPKYFVFDPLLNTAAFTGNDKNWKNDTTYIIEEIGVGEADTIDILLSIVEMTSDSILDNYAEVSFAARIDNSGVNALDVDSKADDNPTNDILSNDNNMTDVNDDEDDHDVGYVALSGFVDPEGYIYCDKSGIIIKGGKIEVTGPGLVKFFHDGSEGMYSWIAEPGTYTMTYNHPQNFPISQTCQAQAGAYDPTGRDGASEDLDGDGTNGIIVLGTKAVEDGYIVDKTCAPNPYYLQFTLATDDPLISGNNLPIQCNFIEANMYVCEDWDGNGVPSVGEKGLANVLVYLYDCNDTLNPIDSLLSDSQGKFRFDALTPGDYMMQYIPPVDYRFPVEASPIGTITSRGGFTECISLAPTECDTSNSTCFIRCANLTTNPIATATIDLGDSYEVAAVVDVSLPIDYTWTPNTFLSCDTCVKTNIVEPEKSQLLTVSIDDNYGCVDTTTFNLIVNRAVPLIIDPCNCLANESSLNAGDGQFSEMIDVTSESGETWYLQAVTGLYKNPSTNFPPASGGNPYIQENFATGINGNLFTEIPLGNGRSRYTLPGIHVDGKGYSIIATNGDLVLPISNLCNYEASCRFGITTSPDGTPGLPEHEADAHNFIIPVDNTPRVDTMLSCEANKNVFTDDGLVDGLYIDTAARKSVLTICPQTQWQTIMVSFSDFDLADGDALNVYEGTNNQGTPGIVMTGTGVSKANGGWVQSHCDPDSNATGCLTFEFVTNGDNNKGRGWEASVSCNDRAIQLTPPNDLSAKLECDSVYAIFAIKPATINSNCGTAIQDSQIVRVFNQHGVVCLDTCLADTDVVRDTFAIGSYLVEYKLKSDTTKTTQAVMTVQGPSLVCNDEVNVPLGSACGLMLTPDDLLESTCDTITDTMYYYITLKGLDKNGNEVVLATGGGKGGEYPMVTKDMIDQCGGSITAEIEKRYYEGLALSICNNGMKSISCSVKVNIFDQSPPVFHHATSNDTFRLCSIDLTADALGIAAPTAVDNCDTVKVEFAGATILNEGGACDTTRAMLNWTATDACGNIATLAQSVVILRPDAADIVQAPDRILSCGEDTDADLNNFAKTGMPRIKVGKVVNGVLQPTDTIDLDTANYVCGYILQKRDIRVPADCGIKVYRYWDVLDWCDTQDGITPIDTQFIELRDTLAPEFVATSLPTLSLELPHDACTLDITKLDKPAATDNCSTPTVTMAKVSRVEDGTKWEIPVEELTLLNADSFEIEWVAADDCHVQTKTTSLTQLVIIEDKTLPSAICTDKINFSLAIDEGNLHYRDFDAGSNDACGIAKYEVSRDEVNWDSVAIFTCEDAHEAIKVYLRVTDVNGNQNTCWTLVNVEDKIAPICSDLPTMTENCDEVHVANGLPLTDTNDNAKMDENEWVDLTEEEAADFNAKYGDPNCSDNITCSELIIQQQYQKIEKACGIATIKRRYRAIDWDGEGRASNWSAQTINIESKADWSITLPADWQGTCGETAPESEVFITNGACDLMAYEVEEKVFTTVEDACLKIVRTFTIINWCTYEAGGETVRINRVEDEHNQVTQAQIITPITIGEGYENVGKLEYVQILKLKDDTAPIITVDTVDSCLDGAACEDTKRFTITATDCNEIATEGLVYNWTISTNGTELAKGEGAFFDYPVASKVIYDVRWTVADNCGNTAWKDVTYEFWDCKKPAPYCLHGIAVDLMENVGTVQIWAKDLSINSSDNCTPTDRLQYKIWHEALGEAPVTDEGVAALPEVITLNCTYLGNQTVNLYVIDEEGNWDYCSTYVNVQDNTGACENVAPEDMAIVRGTIMDWKASNTVEGVKVFSSGLNSAVNSMETEVDGQYNFELAMYDNYTITPEKYDQPLNGVSTFDLVLITKHILGQQEMTNPYQLIAADVNNSKTITAFDMVQTRKLILAIDENFTNNTSWRFVESSYEFTSDNPLTESFPEMATISDLDKDMEMDFVAIKIGDVSGNAKPNSLVAAEDRSTPEVFEITTEEKVLKAGKSYSLTFQTKQLSDIQGYQFTLGYENLKIANLKTGITGVENFGLHLMDKGMITTSWNQEAVSSRQLAVGSTQLTTDNRQPTTLFTVEFIAQKDGNLSEQLHILDRPTAIEAYNQNGEIMEVELTFTKPSITEQFDLFQNQPNPFHDKTMIGFYLPGDSEVQLVLRDEAGRVLKTIKEARKAGHNSIQLDREELTNGFIYYQLSTKYGTKVKKMVKLQ